MSPNKQRLAIAEACGWGLKPLVWQSEIVGYRLIKPDGKVFLFDHWTEGAKECKSWEFACARDVIPNYLNDLNAMYEAEKVLSRGIHYNQTGGFGRYKTALAEVCDEQHPIDATAAQRAEAFLRTLGKWEEDK